MAERNVNSSQMSEASSKAPILKNARVVTWDWLKSGLNLIKRCTFEGTGSALPVTCSFSSCGGTCTATSSASSTTPTR